MLKSAQGMGAPLHIINQTFPPKFSKAQYCKNALSWGDNTLGTFFPDLFLLSME
jgi:hypothetical protein